MIGKRGVLAISMVVLSSCSVLRGDMVESGFDGGDTREVVVQDVEQLDSTVALGDNPAAAAFDFQVIDLLDKATVQGSDLYANRSTIMTFVVPGCPVCVVEAPKIAAAAARHPEISYVMVHTGGSEVDYLDYVAAHGLDAANIVHLRDDRGDLWRRFNIVAQPSTLLLDREGSLSSSSGALGDDGLERAAAVVA